MDEKQQHYMKTKQYFKKNSSDMNGYFETAKHDSRHQKILDLSLSLAKQSITQDKRVASILDAGCGTGEFTFCLASAFPEATQIVGMDFLPELFPNTQGGPQYKRVSFFKGDILDIPFPDTSFDITFCIEVLHHIHKDDFIQALKELARVTRGYLVVEIKNRKNIFDFWFNLILLPLQYKDLPVYTTTMGEVSQLLKQYGFTLQSTDRLASSRWNCRQLVVVYKRDEEV
jgi:ubiquinone/menaquinone biosynthesis C-methylase UbiE